MKHLRIFRACVSMPMALALSASFAFTGCSNTLAQQTPACSYTSVQGETSLSSSEAAARPDGSYMPYADDCISQEDETQFNTEEYSSIDEQAFISTKKRPLSTLSADVDTASYCNMRRMINNGFTLEDIPSGAVRIEEMLNYFTYEYEQPSSGELFSMTARVGRCPWNEDTELMVLGCQAADSSQKGNGSSNLVFLIDTSGSMSSADKLPLLKDSFELLVKNLDADDSISIVTYSGSESVVLDGVAGDDTRTIDRAIRGLETSGSTNGQAGLRCAYELAQKHFIEGGVNRIILASDGDLNVGITSESDLKDYVEQQRDSGIYLSVLGFGSGNYKDNKMEAIADNGNGTYRYIDCIDEAKKVFQSELTSNIVPMVDDVKLQVEFNPAQVKGYRLIGYENRAMQDADFENDAADACEVGAAEQFTVAYELVLTDSSAPIAESDLKYGNGARASWNAPESDEWLTCTMRCKPAGKDEVLERELVVDKGDYADDPGDDWRFAGAVIEFGMLARESTFAGSATIDTVEQTLKSMHLNDEREGFFDLVRSV